MDKATGFGSAFLPKDISDRLMPEGAEEFCVAMGSDKHTLGLTLSTCEDEEGEMCKVFPLHVEIGLEDCEDCLKVAIHYTLYITHTTLYTIHTIHTRH
jgi:hypothetical protein